MKPVRRNFWARLPEIVIEQVVRLCGVSAVIIVFGIFFFVFREAYGLLPSGHFDLSHFLFRTEWNPTAPSGSAYGTLALLVGTFCVTAFSMLLGIPLGLGSAIFLSEFCPVRSRESLKVAIEILAAIPSVVWGFIGLMVMNPLIIAATGTPIGLNILNGGLLLALMSIPIIASLGEDALKAVPDSYREAGLALGATRWQLVYRVLLPAARPGLLAAVLLGVGRSVGETMAVLMATGHSVRIPSSVLDSVRTLTATIAAELGEAPVGSEHYRLLFALGIYLLVFTSVFNLAADFLVRGRRRSTSR